ncbi:MAG: hypothetical protein WC835_01230 [Candidatus Paceibacterota bacterium]|jgi:hypothetical protein
MQKILNHIGEKINRVKTDSHFFAKTLQNKDIFIVLTITLVAFASFGLGRLSKIEENREPVTVENIGGIGENNTSGKSSLPASAVLSVKSNQTPPAGKNYIASKNGAKYFLTWCSGANTIKDANKIWFATKEEASAAGFTPAANCPGI